MLGKTPIKNRTEFYFFDCVYGVSHNLSEDSFLQDRSGNCQPGTTIDEKVCHPTQFDYYQYGHAGIQVLVWLLFSSYHFLNMGSKSFRKKRSSNR